MQICLTHICLEFWTLLTTKINKTVTYLLLSALLTLSGVFGLCGLLDLQNSAHPARRSVALLKGDTPGCRVAHALVVLQVDDVDLVRHVVRVEVARSRSSEPVRLRPPLRLDHVVGGLGPPQLRPLPRALLSVVQRDPDALLSGRRQAHSVRVDVQLGEVELIHVGEHGDGGSLLGASCPPWDFTRSPTSRFRTQILNRSLVP